MSEEPESKRLRYHAAEDRVVEGDEVRLVNLPAFPGLEGLIATIVAVAGDNVDVKLHKTGVVKRIKVEKVRKLLTGSIVELHGLVAAYKLNGQLGECREFDSEMQRYNIVIKSGESKKVKPQNIKFVAKYRNEIVNPLQIRALKDEQSRSTARSSIMSTLEKWECVMPKVVSARVLIDWAKLDTIELRRRLYESKRVDVSTLPDNVKIVFVSLPRNKIAEPDLHACEKSVIKLVESVAREAAPFLEKEWFRDQVYFMMPFDLVDSVELPMIKRGLQCSFPFYMFLVDVTLLCLKKGDDLESLKLSAQRLDVACSRVAGSSLMLLAEDTKCKAPKGVKVSLPSRGRCDDAELSVIKEIEAGMGMERPKDDDQESYFKFSHSF